MGIGYEVHVYSQWNDEKNIVDKETVPVADALRSPGLFNEVLRRNSTLPQYHPKYLMELLDFGKLRRVRAILNHLVSTQGNMYCYSLNAALINSSTNCTCKLAPFSTITNF